MHVDIMTLVVAAQFGSRIIVFSDTMISGDHPTRNDMIPGRLKSIVLDGNCLSRTPDPSVQDCESFAKPKICSQKLKTFHK